MSAPVHWAWGTVGGLGVGIYYGDTLPEYAAAAALGTPWGQKALAHSGRGMAHGAWWAFTRPTTRAIGGGALRAAGSVALAALVPVAVGYAVSYAIDENTGVENFTDFITGGVSPKQYFNAVTLSSMR